MSKEEEFSSKYRIGKDAEDDVYVEEISTEKRVYPECWLDLEPYHSYLLCRKKFDESEQMLADVMAGKYPIRTLKSNASRGVATVFKASIPRFTKTAVVEMGRDAE